MSLRSLATIGALAATLLAPPVSCAAIQDIVVTIESATSQGLFQRWKLSADSATALNLIDPTFLAYEQLGVAKAADKLDASLTYTCTVTTDPALSVRSGATTFLPVFKLKKCAPTTP